MTTPASNQPVSSGAMKRYGPLVAIVVVIAVIAVVVTVSGRKDPSTTDSTSTGAGAGTAVPPPAAGLNPDISITYAQAKAQGKERSIAWVDNCDFATGRIKMPSLYAPPCVPKLTGANGGPTSGGVSADQITIVNYLPSKLGDLQALLAGNLDSDELVAKTTQNYLDMFSHLFETYGRKINLVNFQSNSAPDDATGGHADAVTVAERFHPFASINGPALNPAYGDELARQQILCIGCGIANADKFYQDHAPYMWGPLPSPEEFLVGLSDYMVNRVMGHKAEFAGDELKNQDRKFGVVHFEQNPPVFSELGDKVAACGAAQGWTAGLTETYTFDLGKMGERATTIIAKMKAEGVTTIIFLGDPIMPIYLTKQATAQNYFPEWIETGTVLTDTTVLGRKYDPQQWRHAFGISNLGVRIPREQSEAWRMHQWYFGADPAAVNLHSLIYVALQQVMLGIHMAGPKLNPTTFRDGMFNYPPSGGGPTTPQVSFGDHGYFKLPGEGDKCFSDKPRLDYLGVDDWTEIWWDPNVDGPDEQNKTDAKGGWRYANMGKRYLPGQVSKGPADAFKLDNSITLLDKAPKQDAPPDYPSPAKK